MKYNFTKRERAMRVNRRVLHRQFVRQREEQRKRGVQTVHDLVEMFRALREDAKAIWRIGEPYDGLYPLLIDTQEHV